MPYLKKRGLVLKVLFFIAIFAFLTVVFFVILFFRNNHSYLDVSELENPIAKLNDSQAILNFNESFVYYLLYNIGAYKLHSSPLAKGNPKIGFVVEENKYTAEIIKGKIFVRKNLEQDVDIIIKTSKEEAVKMLRNKENIEKSFEEGKSTIELIKDKKTLFLKGYLSLYTELTGKSVTGAFIRVVSQ